MTMLHLLDHPHFKDHELITSFYDRPTGLRGFFVIHNTNRGPALGGTRYWAYASEAEALQDVLRLSHAMTYKCAAARIPYGGGKAVIIADPDKPKTFELLTAYAKRLNLLGGNFYTGEDVGISQEDVGVMMQHTPYLVGNPGVGGDPGPWAGEGVFIALRAALQELDGTPDMHGKRFAIKGCGKVGSTVCGLLARQGADIMVADINPAAAENLRTRFPGVTIVDPAEIHRQAVDAYVPCALGNEFTLSSVPELRCRLICGGANNQIALPEADALIEARGIVYVPDYVANAGGLINVAAELAPGGYDEDKVQQAVLEIGDTVRQIIHAARQSGRTTVQVADQLAEDFFLHPDA